MGLNINALQTEGMAAIQGLLEGLVGTQNPSAALEIARAMQNIQLNPRMLYRARQDLLQFRERHPEVALEYLTQTFAWVDQHG